MVLREWREAIMAPTTEKGSSVTRLTTTLLSSVSPPNGRSETVELAARDNANPPTSSATDSAISDHAIHVAARVPIPPIPRFCSLAPSVTTPLYSTAVSQTLRQPLRGSFSEPTGAEAPKDLCTVRLSDVCLYPRNWTRIFRGGGQVDESATYFPRPTAHPSIRESTIETRSSSTPPVRELVGRAYWVS
jgi:hypothetical protein